VRRLRALAAVLGHDLHNEPAPGSAAQEIFGTVLHVFAQSTGQEFEQLRADPSDPHRKFAQLEKLENTEVHRAIGDALSPLLEQFETTFVHPFMTKVARARSEEHTSELQSRFDLVCRLLLEIKQAPHVFESRQIQ